MHGSTAADAPFLWVSVSIGREKRAKKRGEKLVQRTRPKAEWINVQSVQHGSPLDLAGICELFVTQKVAIFTFG
jgi:hypothetical protein